MFTKISSIDLSRMLNGEFLQMMKNFQGFVERYGAGVLGIEAFFNIFVPAVKEGIAALETEKSSGYSPAIEVGDRLRDNNYRVLHYVVKAFTFSAKPELKEAADQLMRIMADDLDPLTAAMDTETLLLDSLVEEMRKEPYSGFLERLHATELLNDVAEANDAVNKLGQLRTDEQGKKPTGNVGITRKKINPIYRNMVNTVNMLAPLYPKSKEFDEFTNLVDTDVRHYRSLIAQRETRNNNKKNEEGE